MPEYLAPGVYVQETSFRSRSIEGVATSTAGFVGPARRGPVGGPPALVTGLDDFERLFGDGRQLDFGGPPLHDYLWHGVRAFFAEGGRRLFVARIFAPLGGAYPPRDPATGRAAFAGARTAPRVGQVFADGHGRACIPATAAAPVLDLRARHPGAAGNLDITVALRLGPNALGTEPVLDAGGRPLAGPDGRPRQCTVARGLAEADVVWVRAGPAGAVGFRLARAVAAGTAGAPSWRFAGPGGMLDAAGMMPPQPGQDPAQGDQVRVLTLAVTVGSPGETWGDLAPDPRRAAAGGDGGGGLGGGGGPGGAVVQGSLAGCFADDAIGIEGAALPPLVITLSGTGPEGGAPTGLEVVEALLQEARGRGRPLEAALADPGSSEADRSLVLALSGGNDGRRPTVADYAGTAGAIGSPGEPAVGSGMGSATGPATGLAALAEVEEVAIVAAPGAAARTGRPDDVDALGMAAALVAHAEAARYRIALLEGANGQGIEEVRWLRGQLDSSHAAVYTPWVLADDPVTGARIPLPPSGFVAGLYARADIERGVHKAPADEPLRTAAGFEMEIDQARQDILNPEGINCFRSFPGRGHRLWGARTVSSDPEWKYLSVRRYFLYLEHSIDRSTRWAVFEPNGETLWTGLRAAIEDFLHGEWRRGGLLGATPKEAFFVRCDRSTMTQADLDEGHLVCLVGCAVLRSAEFVIFRIGQSTADRKG